jgi:hypothetical protein
MSRARRGSIVTSPFPGPDAPAPPEPSGRKLAEAARFFGHKLTKRVFFPGDHGGFLGAPREFADRLQEVLAL